MKKRGRVRVFAMYIALCMLFSLMPVTPKVVYAEDATEEATLQYDISGTTYTFGETVSPALPEGLSWDNTTKTLTLTNYKGTYIHSEEYGQDLNLHLVGINTLTRVLADDGGSGIYMNAGNLTITGDEDAGLNISVTGINPMGIYILASTANMKELNLMSGTVNIEAVSMEKTDVNFYQSVNGISASAVYTTIAEDAKLNINLNMKKITKPSSGSAGIYGAAGTISISGDVSVNAVRAEDSDVKMYGINGSSTVTSTGSLAIETNGQASSRSITTADNHTVYGTYTKRWFTILPAATEAELTQVTDYSITLSAPVTGETPVYEISEEGYNGYVEWSGSPTMFGKFKKYTATISLIPKYGYTFHNLTSDFFHIVDTEGEKNATSVTYDADTYTVTASFAATGDKTGTTINIYEIEGVTIPKGGRTASATVIETEQYTGTIKWSYNPAGPFLDDGHVFFNNQVYTAVIELTAKEGYTGVDVPANCFTVEGAETVTNSADSIVVTAVFPNSGKELYRAIIDDITYNFNEDGVTPKLPEGLTWDAENATIIMENYTGSYIHVEIEAQDLRIHLKGDNYLTGSVIWSSYSWIATDCWDDDLYITADENATLNMLLNTTSADNIIGLDVAGMVYLSGGTVTATMTQSDADSTGYTVFANTQVYMANSANLNVTIDASAQTNPKYVYGVKEVQNFSAGDVSITVRGKDAVGITGNWYMDAPGIMTVEADGVVSEKEPFLLYLIYPDVDYKIEGDYNTTKMVIDGHACKEYAVISSKEATDTETGVKVHYICERCGKLYWDDACTQTIANEEELIIAVKEQVTEEQGSAEETTEETTAEENTEICGNGILVPAKAATMKTAGTKEHYTCSTCGKMYWDAACTQPITDANEVVIAQIAKVKLKKTTYVYNKKKHKPSVVVTDANGNVLKKGTDYKVSYKDNINVGKAKAVITFKGNYQGKVTKTYTIIPKTTYIKKLIAKDKSIRIEWKAQKSKMAKKRITGYQIQYSTSSKFKASKTKSVTVKGYKSVSKRIKGLKAGKTYYVRVRTYSTVSGKKIYGKWSKTKKIKVK